MLKRMTFFGFKSFADEVVVDFTNGINVVIGPNGCGKSNIFDGLRWVLGEQSAKSLRGGKMEDVIFAGSDTRKPRDHAEVTLVLDNADGLFRVPLPEISITRKAFRGGGSEYFINNEPCRMKDVHHLIMDTGVGSNSYSMIGQGQIEKILSTKLDERRAIFEEAAGIVKLKQQKEKTEKSLAEVDTNLIRMNDIINEINRQLEPLRRQAKKAREHMELKTQLETIEVQYLLHEMDALNERIDDHQGSIESNQISLEDHTAMLTENEALLTQLKTTYQEENEEAFQAQEKSGILQQEVEKVTGFIALNVERIENAHKTIAELEQTLHEIEENVHSSTDDVQQKQRRHATITNELDEKELALSAISDRLTALEQEKMQLSSDTNVSRESSIDEYNTLNQEKYELEQLVKREKELVAEQEEILAKREVLLQEKQEIEGSYTAAKTAFDAVYEKLSTLKNSLKTNQERFQTLRTRVQEEQQLLQQKERELFQKKNRVENLESFLENNETFFDGVKAILQLKKDGKLTGVLGAVAELVQVNQAYETAIEGLLQGAMQHVVVEHDGIAKQAVRYLKENRAGRATFLPLNMTRSATVSPDEKRTVENTTGLRFATEALTYGSQVAPIVESLLGRSVIADNLDIATDYVKNHQSRLRVATVDGEIVQAGSISGGESARGRASFFAKRRELDELKEVVVTLESDLSSMQKAVSVTQKEYNELEELILSFSSNVNDLSEDVSSKQSVFEEAKRKFERMEEQEQNLDIKEQELSFSSKETARKRVSLTFSIEDKERNYQRLSGDLDSFTSRLDQIAADTQRLTDQKTELLLVKTQLHEELRGLNEYLEEMSEDSGSLEDKIKRLYEKKEEELTRITEFEENKRNLEAELTRLQEELNGYNRQVEQMRAQNADLVKKIEETEEFIKRTRKEKESVEKEIHEDEVALSRCETQKTNILTRFLETYEMDEDTLGPLERVEIDMEESQKQVNGLKKKISALGNINHNAIEECEALEERYQTENTQFTDVKTAKEDLMKLLEDVQNEMVERFTTTFTTIADHFERIFVEMFEGGHAKLTLVDEKDPLGSAIDIIARPPGKKPQSINSLSGGEKAFTATALIFAIITSKPSPFVVLDEVDAALDEANVARFAAYLKKMSTKCQFIAVSHRKPTMLSTAEPTPPTHDEQGVLLPPRVGNIIGITQEVRGVTIAFPYALSDIDKLVGLDKKKTS